MNAVPIPARAAAANGQYPIVIFDRAELDVVFVVLHNAELIRNSLTPRINDRVATFNAKALSH